MVLALNADESARNRRVDSRTDGFGEWEQKLRASPEMGRRIMSIMQNIDGVKMRMMDSSGTREEMLQGAVIALQEYLDLDSLGQVAPKTQLISKPNLIGTREQRPMTLVMIGPHCSGKSTIGRAVANTLGWTFDGELGDMLKDSDGRAADEHLLISRHLVDLETASGGCREGIFPSSWDDFIFEEEGKRDTATQSAANRVVETWHVSA
jgi:hypothetical protein